MKSSTMRVWNLAAALIMASLIALGWFLGISPKLADATRFDSERAAVQAQNDLARIQIAQLQQDSTQLAQLRAELAQLRAAFPTQAEYDSLIESLYALVGAQGLTLDGVTVGEPTPTTPTVLSSGDAAPETSVTEAGTVPAGTLLVVPTTLSVQGSLSAILSFIDALQRVDRFGVVSTWSFSGSGSDGDGSAGIPLNVYVVAGDDLPGVESNVAVPAPAPTSTPTPTAEPSSEPTDEATDPAATTPSTP